MEEPTAQNEQKQEITKAQTAITLTAQNYSKEEHKYTHKITDLVYEEDMLAMLALCKTDYERGYLALTWKSGGRPMEILDMVREDVRIYEDSIFFKVKTLKIGRIKNFVVSYREFNYNRPKTLDENVWIEAIARIALATPQGSKIIPLGKRWAEKLVNRLGMRAIGKMISPYHLRHSFFTHQAADGKTIDELKTMKGSTTTDSIARYIQARPIYLDAINKRSFRIDPSQQSKS